MEEKIETLTPEQEALIDVYYEKWLNMPLHQGTRAEIEAAVEAAYKLMDLPMPKVVLAENPDIACIWAEELLEGAGKSYYCGYWWMPWAARHDYAHEVLGVEDDGTLATLKQIYMNMPFSVPLSEVCIVSLAPKAIHWSEAGQLHCEDGPAVEWAGKFGLWSINGVPVTEQIVLCPDTLTADEVDAIENAETRRVAIERMGAAKYLLECGAKLVDADHEAVRVGGAARCLLENKKGEKWLVGTDGSTKRVYYMPVPDEVETCAAAHCAIAGFKSVDVERRCRSKS